MISLEGVISTVKYVCRKPRVVFVQHFLPPCFDLGLRQKHRTIGAQKLQSIQHVTSDQLYFGRYSLTVDPLIRKDFTYDAEIPVLQRTEARSRIRVRIGTG